MVEPNRRGGDESKLFLHLANGCEGFQRMAVSAAAMGKQRQFREDELR
jgi:hypothetical protein